MIMTAFCWILCCRMAVAQNYKIVGTWKVYGDEREAEKRFNRFRKCTADYCMRMEKGSTLDKLAVAL